MASSKMTFHKSPALVFFLLLLVATISHRSVAQSSTAAAFHETLTPEERIILLGHPVDVPHYEMFSTSAGIHSALRAVDHRRSKRSADTKANAEAHLSSSSSSATPLPNHQLEPILIEFTAFSQPFRLRLWPNHKLLAPSFQMINEMGKGNSKSTSSDEDARHLRESLASLEDCFYQGVAETHPASAVAVSLCNGMQGVIETKSGVYIVNPLPGHTVGRYFNSTTTTEPANTYHIILRKNDDEFNDYQCPHKLRQKTNLATAITTRPGGGGLHPAPFDLIRIHRKHQQSNATRAKRSIDVIASDLNFLDADSSSSASQEEVDSPTKPTAPIQLDDISTNDVYDDPNDSSASKVSSSKDPPPPTSTNNTSSTYSPSDSNFNITVETAVFVDESLYHLLSKTFPIDTEQQIVLYVLTIMNAVQLLFKQPSIGRSVEISVVLMDLLKQQPKNLHPSDNIDTYLTNFCVWQHKKRLRESGGPTPDWDHALLLSGINMYVVDSLGRRKRHVVGLAPVSGMCNSLNSCTISEGTSFQTVLVAGHEMGHSLGMEHDGTQDGNACNKDDFVMSPTLGPGKTTWSDCSRQYLDKFVLTPQATCILGRSSHVNIIQQFIPIHQLPGERFSVDDQCQFRFGPTARHYSGQAKKEICRVIKCHVKPSHHRKHNSRYYPTSGRSVYSPYPPKSTYNTHPALEGTECGPQMWCREGHCVSKMDALISVDIPSSSVPTSGLGDSNDVDNYLISRTNYQTTTEHPRPPKNTPPPKLNRLKPKPNPYHYKYNPADKFGSRTTSSSANYTATSADYLSTNKYNPYNDVATPTSQSTSGWKPTRDRKNTSPRPAVNGNWSHWTSFGPCISECVTASGPGIGSPVPIGIMTALRRCNNPIPLNGGADCSGADTKVKLCNALQVCSIESSISAASGLASTRIKAEAATNLDHLRYRIRTVDEYIADTCSAAAKLNDKLEHHGTQYPSYDSASHSCYVWCHKRGGGYMSQGWRLPDGTPCGRKEILGSSGNATSSSTGYCYNGQCRPFNCLGEMYYRTAGSPGSSNVYSGSGGGVSSLAGNETVFGSDEVDCGGGLAGEKLILPGFDLPSYPEREPEDETTGNGGDFDSSYRLVRVRGPKPDVAKTQEMPSSHFSSTRSNTPNFSGPSSAGSILGPAQQNFFNSLHGFSHQDTSSALYSNWSDWTPVTECQYSTACITTGRGFRLVTRECKRQNTCVGRREALQVCEEITQSVHRDPTLYDLYEQYCPATKRISADVYAGQICGKYRIKYPSLLSGNGRQLLGKNSGCIVACEDRVWKDIHYQMDAFEDGKFPFGTDCSEVNSVPGTGSGPGYCLNGKCIRFDPHGISFDTAESILYRSEILQLFAPEATGALSVLSQNPESLQLPVPAGFASTSSSDNSLLYSTISNELYKRATSHQSSPGPVQSKRDVVQNVPNHFNLVSSTSGSSSAPAPATEDQLTYATPRRPSEIESGRVQLRRIKRSALHTFASRTFRTTASDGSGTNPILFRKASVQEALDPEADYVSWTLIRSTRSRATLKPGNSASPPSWSPVLPKKPLRPIKLSHFTLTAKRVPNPPPKPRPPPEAHLQTFTLVKHDKSRFANHLRQWQPTLNHIALPLGNQTHFLDDDEDEEEVDHSQKTYKESKDSKSQSSKAKILKHFGLGHESWPENEFTTTSEDGGPSGGGSSFTETPPRPRKRPNVELRVEPYVWSVILSECSRSCGSGIRTVRVVCTVGQKTVDERFCDGEGKPIHKRVEPCKERDCVGRWRSEPWSQCSTKCPTARGGPAPRNGYQSRTIICVGPSHGGGSGSGSHSFPPRSKRQIEEDDENEEEEGEEQPVLSFADEPEEVTTTEEPEQQMTTPSPRAQHRVYSILSHQFCDPDSKPVQWRSCPATTTTC